MLLPVCCACWVSRWAEEHNKLFVASVGPGYDDSKIRPWVSPELPAAPALLLVQLGCVLDLLRLRPTGGRP